MSEYPGLPGRRLALVLRWKKNGEEERAVFFGRLARCRAGLSFGRPGVTLDLPKHWLPRIQRTPADLVDIVEKAPFVLELMLDEVPVEFSPQQLVKSGF